MSEDVECPICFSRNHPHKDRCWRCGSPLDAKSAQENSAEENR